MRPLKTLKRTTWLMRRYSPFAKRTADRPPLLRGRSSRPFHLAPALLKTPHDLRAIDHLGDLEKVVRRRTLSLRLADEQGSEQLILAGAVEGRVRPKRDFRREMEILQDFRHIERLERIRLRRGERAGPDRDVAEPGARGRHPAGAFLGRLDEFGDMGHAG